MSHKLVLLMILTLQVVFDVKPQTSATVSAKATEKKNQMKIALKDIRSRGSTNDSLSSLAVFLEADQNQSHGSGGILLDIHFANNSNEHIEILNPLDSIQMLILNKEGWPVNLPPFPPRALINKRGDEKMDQGGPFEVVKVISDGQKKPRQDIYESKIRIAPRGSYKITLKIARVLANPKKPQDTPERAPAGGQQQATAQSISIPAGDYQIKLTIPVISSLTDDASRVFQSDSIKISLL